jgi:hypothetical protein
MHRRNKSDVQSGLYSDLGKLIHEYRKTTLGYGSEFRPTVLLRPLLGRHPNFNSLEEVINHGMRYVFTRELDTENTAKGDARYTGTREPPVRPSLTQTGVQVTGQGRRSRFHHTTPYLYRPTHPKRGHTTLGTGQPMDN